MFKKATMALVCGLATMGALGAVATSAMANDPNAAQCQGKPNGVNFFHITTGPTTAGADAEIFGGGLLCGSDFGGGKEFGYTSGAILNPTGVKVRCANPKNPNACKGEKDLEVGRYVGSINVAVRTVGDMNKVLDNLVNRMYVYQAPPSIVTGKQAPNNDCTADAIACYQSTDVLGTGAANTIVKKSESGRMKMIIGKPVPLIPEVKKIYYLRIGGTAPNDPRDMHLCKYAGAVNGQECGADPADWLQKNGPKGSYICDEEKFEANFFAGLSGAANPPYPGIKEGYHVGIKPTPNYKAAPAKGWEGSFCASVSWT